MPYRRDGGLKVTDHYIRSPLQDVRHACGTCHRASDEALTERVLTIQHRNKTMVHKASIALGAAVDALTAARQAGASDAQLEDARRLHRQAQLRWDFVESENSAGFHSPQEAARVLLDATDLARQAQLAAHLALPDHGLAAAGGSTPGAAP